MGMSFFTDFRNLIRRGRLGSGPPVTELLAGKKPRAELATFTAPCVTRQAAGRAPSRGGSAA